MPTNQSSPWDGPTLRTCSNAKSPTTATSVSTHTKTVVANKVPFGQTSLELTGRKVQVKPLYNVASSAPPTRHSTVALSVVSIKENGDGSKTNTQSQFTAGPHRSPRLPQHLNGIQNQALGTGLKQLGSSLAETCAPSSIPKRECQNGHDVQPTGTTQKCMLLETSQPGSGSTTRGHQVAAGDSVEPPSPVYEDLSIKGQRTLQQTNKLMPEAADCSCLPLVPPLRLTPCDYQRPALGQDASSTDSAKAELKSTSRETTMWSHSAKATKCSVMQNPCTTTSALNNEPVIRDGSSAAATINGKPQTIAPLDLKRQALESQCPLGSPLSTCRRIGPPAATSLTNGSSVLSANVSATTLGAITAVASSPAGALMGSVTNQISAIQLTRPRKTASPSLTDDCDTSLSGQDWVMQVDGVEEELPDELENACSDEDDSDCSSINCSSTASIAALCGVEPMPLGSEDDREERPALVPSLFPFIPPTLYFSTANEKVELLPAEQRRLLKWKISTVTPNIVKHTIGRSHFKVTKKSHDWLGCWGHHMKSPCFKSLGEHQKLNHFPGTFQIGRKDRLWRNLSKMQVRFGKQEFSFFPRTFVLPQDTKLLRKAWEDGGSRQKWIIKPPASARGIGIQVIHKWSQMPRKRPLLVQKYLHKPYLISGNKFDLRIYVYVTCYEPLRMYIFSDGLVRFASCKYSSSMKTLGNKFMHLTNYSVNKKNSEYQTNSDDKACQGHKWTLKALWQYLGSKGVNTSLIWEKIKDIVIKTVIGSEPYVNSLLKMHVRTPYSCHELFGFDIMLDEKLKPWILEVNISPSLHSNTALDVSVKGQMIRDLLNLAGFHIPQRDDVVPPSSSSSSSTSSLSMGSRERKPDLSSDEKVKRAFYLTQRYADQDFLSTVLDVLTPEDVRVLAESEDELTRLGQFERIFPSPSSSRYLRFFECPRYLNILLDQWEQKYWSNRTKGISLLRTLCEKGIHLGTNDPCHMWSKCSYISKFEPHRLDFIGPSRSRVVVTHQRRSHHDDCDDGSDMDAASVSSLPISPSPGSSVTSSACASPQPSLTQSLLPQHFASL